MQDARLDLVQHRARRLLTGFTAQNQQQAKVRDLRLAFFRFQSQDGNIVDGYIPDAKAERSYLPDRFIYSDLMPGYAAHKNTVETDQESSLIPAKEFPKAPHNYQNAGNWTWFGSRFMQALTNYGLVAEAYAELDPMLERTIANKGFHEWYDVRTGAPKGSGEFRGEAGVLLEAITLLRSWAKAQK